MFRAGMWVINAADRVGLCYTNTDTGASEVHLVDTETGETTETLAWSPDWKQATHAQIPVCRRPDAGVAMKFGYAVSEGDAAKAMAAREAEAKGRRVAELEAELVKAKK